jgi:hypothetical protein
MQKKHFVILALMTFMFVTLVNQPTGEAAATTEAYTLESAHNYANSFDYTWTITKTGASQIRVYFDRYQVESNYDYIYVMSKTGSTFNTYTSSTMKYAVWSSYSYSDTIKIRLKTDSSVVYYGFKITQIDYTAGSSDTTPPTVSVTAPTNGATVSGTTSVTASASDNVGVSKVEFYIDSALKSTDTASPYSYSWDTTTYSNAAHGIYAKAYDAANNAGTSSTISVTVSNTAPPPPSRVAGFEGYLYTGQTHNHAKEYGDDGLNTISSNLNYMKSTATPVFDFGGLTPHNHMVTDANMLTYWNTMNSYTTSTFVTIPGQEWSSTSTSNHVNVFLADARCNVANGDIPGFYSWLQTHGGYATFNHPGYGNDMSNWQYYASCDKPGNYEGKVVAMEMKQTLGSTSWFSDYTEALGKGWHIGMVNSDDNHEGNPGDKFTNNPRTGMWLSSLTAANIEKALQELRFFGTQVEGAYVDLQVGSYTMGDVFSGTNGMTLTAKLNPGLTYTSVQIYIDGTAYTMSGSSGTYTYTINAGEKHYYFVRAKTSSGGYVISSPMWSDTGASPPPPPPSGNVLTSGVTVTGTLSAAGATAMWTIQVASGATSMHFVLTCSTGDYDGYGKLGSEPTTSSYTWRAYNDGNEDYSYANPGAGTWYIMVCAYSGSGTYSLTVTIT